MTWGAGGAVAPPPNLAKIRANFTNQCQKV